MSGCWEAHVRHEPVDSSNGTAIFPGDIIMREADGNVAPATAGNTQIIGVCVGIVPDKDNLSRKYLPASTAGTVLVCEDPNVILEVQEDGVGGTLTSAAIGTNADHVAGAGSTTTGISAHTLDSSSIVDTTAGFRIIGLVNRPDNEAGSYAKWLVMINEHSYKTTTGV
jgi:hypothetical protein